MPQTYDPSAVEAKWQKKWEETKIYEVDLKKAKDPFYSLVMFPYPSGDKLHVGHWYNFAPADSYARYVRMHGKDVFEPMGFDAFGLPAENYAIKTGVHPTESISKNTETMTQQLKRIGCMYDWNKTVNTSTPEYYRWTQWLFLQMFKNDLAYRKEANVNFCSSCQTVLANEQAQDGTCERCDTEVVQKPLTQWFWKTTAYAQQLLDGLDSLDWPEMTKLMQTNWIGRSEGTEVIFEIEGTKRGIVGPINWPEVNDSLAGDLNRRLTDEQTKRIYSRVRTVHLTFTPYKRMDMFHGSKFAASILRILDAVAEKHDIFIHEAVAMPEHIHLLVSFDEGRHLERDIVKKLKGASARYFLKSFDVESSHLWGEKKHFEDVGTSEQFQSVLQYIRQNPEKAGISTQGRILSQLPEVLTVFTTRPDTLFGATYMVLAPDYPLVDVITADEHRAEVDTYRKEAARKTELERTDLAKEKTGVDTGAFAVNPVNGEKIPIWIADYVLSSYGTGAIMAVPGHDERDYEFACRHGMANEIRCVVEPKRDVVNFSLYVHPSFAVSVSEGGDMNEAMQYRDDQDFELALQGKKCWTGPGKAINSDFLDGLETQEAKKTMIEWLEKEGKGKGVINYRLRDWSISRQRYWGPPIPIVYCDACGEVPVPEEDLPILLPKDVDYIPKGDERSPLATAPDFVKANCPNCGKEAEREVDTMDTFVDSSFYYLRYLAEGDEKQLVDPKIEKKWMPVDMYIGGPEHACMHLIYARFVMMALKDFGFVSHNEPFQRLIHQGLITNEGAKMSKSKGNVVSPDAFVEKYGSDVFRMYLMFMGPFTDGGDWNDTGIKGIDRFVQRIWKALSGLRTSDFGLRESSEVRSKLHATIKKVTEDIEKLHFNTAISALMELLNLLEKQNGISNETAQTFAKLIAPMAPHLAEELWEAFGGNGFVIEQPWPTYDASLLKTDTVTVVVQVNGKVRAELVVPTDISEADVIAQAIEHENVQKHLEGKEVKKEIYVKGKLVSLVV